MRKPKRGNIGESTEGLNIDTSSARWEYNAFSQLGPKTRKVLNYALVPLSASNVLYHARGCGLDPIRDDAAIASDIKKKIRQATGVAYSHAVCERKNGKNKRRRFP